MHRYIFYCPGCLGRPKPAERRLTIVSYDYANKAGTGTFCSERCANIDQGVNLRPEGSQMEMSPEDLNERYWRFRSQLGDHDLPDGHTQIQA